MAATVRGTLIEARDVAAAGRGGADAPGDPVLRRFDEAAEDDEPLTDDESAALADGLPDLPRGNVTPLPRDGPA